MPAPILGPRRRRLESLKDGGPVTTPRNSPPRAPAKKKACCDKPDFEDNDAGGTVCVNCGTVLGSTSELRAELEFGETSSGAAMVQGGLVREDQRHANSMGGKVRGINDSGMSQAAVNRGMAEIEVLCGALVLGDAVKSTAQRLYRLASTNGFVQGRRMKNVAACCIYLSDRKQQMSKLLLMDLAVQIEVSVWVLGDTYKQLLDCLMEVDPVGVRLVPQLEPLILKFCQKLEFDSFAFKVAADALMILKRMNRDWMVDGRQPAGVIGAAIILAARMNNFRRTVREVVYTVKVADSTINQRLYEFRRTKASKLTITQFKKYSSLLKDDILPPAIYRRQEKEEKRKRKLAALSGANEDATTDAEVVVTGSARRTRAKVTKKRKTAKGGAEPTASDNAETTSTQNARDENGFLIPDIPLNPHANPQDTMNFESEDHLEYVAAAAAPEAVVVDDEDEDPDVVPIPKKRGRPPKNKGQPIIIPDEELEIEAEIETELRDNLRAWENIFQEISQNEEHAVLVAANAKAEALVREHMTTDVPETEIVAEDEFEDDEDVANCILAPAEVAIKEKVWITQNEDWLRAQQEKMLKKELEQAQGKPKKSKRRKKRSQLGDGSVLDGQPADSAADAVGKMLAKRANAFSSHIDYERLQALFKNPNEEVIAEGSADGASPAANGVSPTAGTPRSQNASAQPSAQHTPAAQPQVVGDDEDEGNYDEDEEVQEVYDEPDDDPNMYMSDEEYGFEDIQDDF